MISIILYYNAFSIMIHYNVISITLKSNIIFTNDNNERNNGFLCLSYMSVCIC